MPLPETQPGESYTGAFLCAISGNEVSARGLLPVVKHLSACLNAHLLRARDADSHQCLVARREAAFNQGHPTFQLQHSQDTKGVGGGDEVVHNSCHPLP